MDKISSRTVTNIASYRTETTGGRNYLVVSAVPVREQVMNSYYVPKEELSFADMWNGTPITIRHPKNNSGSANVPQPDVAIIGRFFNGVWDEEGNRVVGEYWIDIDEAMRYVEGQYIINAVYNNKVLETSTGYWADSISSPGEFGGKKYVTIHRNLKPDHIAILVDEVGACSVADGCGVNRNSLVYQLWTNECMYTQGGPGSGDFGHTGRPGQVGGSGARTKVKPPKNKSGEAKTLKQSINAYYVASSKQAAKYRDGFKTRTSLMNKTKAETLFESMNRGGFDPVIFEVGLAKGTPYSSISSSSITVPSVPASAVKEITFESLQKRTGGTFKNNLMEEADCGCKDKLSINANDTSLSDKIEGIRKSFYDEFVRPNDSMWIQEIFDEYCIIHMGDQLYKATYTMNNDGEVEFNPQDEWVKVATEYVEQSKQSLTTNVVAKDAPAEVKKIFERVYQTALKQYDGDKEKAAKIAWGAVHKAGWMQDESGKWMKSKMQPKGGDASKNVKVVSTNKQTKESKMSRKLSVNAVLDLIRGKGVDVQVNEEELEPNLQLELPDDDEGEGDEEDNTTTQNASQFTQEEVAGLRKLLAVNWDKVTSVIDKLPTVLEMAQNAETEKATKKAELVAMILNSNTMFNKDELEGMSLPVLTKLNAQNSVNYAGLAGVQFNSNSEDEEVLGLPDVSFAKE